MRAALVSAADALDTAGANRSLATVAIGVAATKAIVGAKAMARARSGAMWTKQTGLSADAFASDSAAADYATASHAGHGVAIRFNRATADAASYADAADDAGAYSEMVAGNEAVIAWDDERASLSFAARQAGYTLITTWNAESGACEYCWGLNGTEWDDVPSETPPAHPRCLCSLSTRVA